MNATKTPPARLLLGPGPSMVHPRVSAAMARPIVGHLDPYFMQLLGTVQDQLRRLFRTHNALTLPISGTGSAGMETCFANLIEPGDEVVIGVNGVFGTRMAEVCRRLGADVHAVEFPWGGVVDSSDIEATLSKCKSPKLVAFVHAETSTGVWQPVEDIVSVARRFGALVVLDMVTSLGGCPVSVDEWQIDAGYSGTQKCLSAPPGLSPVTFSERAIQTMAKRKTKVSSWYLDLQLIGNYFGEDRVYHHTAPISMVYALAEALDLVFEEGLEARFERHATLHKALIAALDALDLEAAVPEEFRLWMLNSVRVPEGLDDAELRKRLLVRHGIEIGPGLGPLAGKVLRIGLMGESASAQNVRRLILALSAELDRSDDSRRKALQAIDEISDDKF